MTQFRFFLKDINRMLGKHKYRVLYIWLSRAFAGVMLYRIERSLYLLFGKSYGVFRIPLIPIFNIIQAYSNIDIHYEADINGGILVLHPSVGCVISGQAIIGENLTLTGGNIIGTKKIGPRGSFVLGNNCTIGANATLIGPLKLGNDIIIGASACVTREYLIDGSVLTGVPAKSIEN